MPFAAFKAIQKRNLSSYSSQLIRNIGIIAHIDAGKTTTTERMLYYAGHTQRLGLVDRGDTVMDFLPAERERGITIKSATISFGWKDHLVNLIDTPGHVDFGVEVECGLRVMDGTILIIDAGEGVQAQTRAVWEQARANHLPIIVLINKMDKIGADHIGALQSLQSEFEERGKDGQFLLFQKPIFEKEAGRFAGIEDLVGSKRYQWDYNVLNDGKSFAEQEITTRDHGEATSLWESIAMLDEKYCEQYLENTGRPPSASTIQNLVKDRKIFPVFLASSFKNTGVQPLMDAITKYLPAPIHQESKNPKNKNNLPLTALAYKVVRDQNRGLLTFLRVYTGKLSKSKTVYNVNSSKTERIGKVMKIFADNFEECEEIGAGNVAVVTGLKETSTGDTIASTKEAERLRGVSVKDPVFSVSIEADSVQDECHLDDSLRILCLEDPSLKVTISKETQQRHLGGMGELHLEVVKERLLKDFKAKASFGPIEIIYKECVEAGKDDSGCCVIDSFDAAGFCIEISTLSSKTHPCEIHYSRPLEDLKFKNEIEEGVRGALNSGGSIGGHELLGLQISLTPVATRTSNYSNSNNLYSTPSPTNAIYKALLERFGSLPCRLLEPLMRIHISISSSQYYGAILADIHNARRGLVLEADGKHEIIANVPLKELLGYASILRSKTGGSASFTMTPNGWSIVSDLKQSEMYDS